MKTLFSVLLFLITVKGFSQEQINPKKQDNVKYSAKDSIVTDQRNNMLSLYGDVNFQIDQLSLQADKVVFDRKNHQVLVTGLKSYTFPYKVRIDKGSKKGILKYKLGDDTIFIE